MASLYLALAERYRLIRLNGRGFGLSENPFPRFGMTPTGALAGATTREMGLDISAVAAACGLERFTLMAVGPMGPVAVEYAADHPDQITGLILCDAVAAIESSHMAEPIRAQALMARLSDEVSSEITFRLEWAPVDDLAALLKLVSAAKHQVAKTPDIDAAHARAVLEWDATSRMADIVAPTIVLCGRGTANQDPMPDAQRLATGIPGAHLRVIDGPAPPYVADQAAVLDAIDALHR